MTTPRAARAAKTPINDEAGELGAFLRGHRKHPMIQARKDLQVSPDTLTKYEHGQALPDLSFLVLHAKHYKTNFAELLVKRLRADPSEEVRSMVSLVEHIEPEVLRSPKGHLGWGLKKDLLTLLLEAVEAAEKRWRGTPLTPRRRAEFIADLYMLLRSNPDVDAEDVRTYVYRYRPIEDSRVG